MDDDRSSVGSGRSYGGSFAESLRSDSGGSQLSDDAHAALVRERAESGTTQGSDSDYATYPPDVDPPTRPRAGSAPSLGERTLSLESDRSSALAGAPRTRDGMLNLFTPAGLGDTTDDSVTIGGRKTKDILTSLNSDKLHTFAELRTLELEVDRWHGKTGSQWYSFFPRETTKAADKNYKAIKDAIDQARVSSDQKLLTMLEQKLGTLPHYTYLDHDSGNSEVNFHSRRAGETLDAYEKKLEEDGDHTELKHIMSALTNSFRYDGTPGFHIKNIFFGWRTEKQRNADHLIDEVNRLFRDTPLPIPPRVKQGLPSR